MSEQRLNSTITNDAGELVVVEGLDIKEVKNSFWKVTVQVIYDEGGKMKKMKLYHLIDAFNMPEIIEKSNKVLDALYGNDDTVVEWKIISVNQNNSMLVY